MSACHGQESLLVSEIIIVNYEYKFECVHACVSECVRVYVCVSMIPMGMITYSLYVSGSI